MSKKLNYNLSIDYEILERLLLNGERVIGLFTPKEGVQKVELFYYDSERKFFDIGAKIFEQNRFIQSCKIYDVRFILPNKK